MNAFAFLIKCHPMNKISASILFMLTFCFMLQGCFKAKKSNEASAREEIIKTDLAFSKMSEKKGMKKAFLEYIDDNGILLRPGHLPIVGASAIDFLSQINDSSSTLTWAPSGANAAASGDLGFSYGIYSLALQDTILFGTYVSIWKKQSNGKWKFVLDTGNEGTGSSVTTRD
jgi:ketosteroid isomerase-like protein